MKGGGIVEPEDSEQEGVGEGGTAERSQGVGMEVVCDQIFFLVGRGLVIPDLGFQGPPSPLYGVRMQEPEFIMDKLR